MPNHADVVTLTLSPALDLSTTVDVVAPTHKLRCSPPLTDPGGGGINVARVAQRLGADVLAVAPLGGANGDAVERFLTGEGVAFSRVDVDSSTRQSFSVFEEKTGDQFRFVVPGEPLSADELERCVNAAIDVGRGAGCVVLSGSLPEGVSADFMSAIVRGVAPTRVVVDASGDALLWALSSGAYLVKPSASELSSIAGKELVTERDILEAAHAVLERASVNALLVSIGPGGAFLLERGHRAVRFRAPTVRVASAVGAGDAMVAGVAVGLSNGLDLLEATRRGIAAGTAAVLTDGTMLCRRHEYDELLPMVAVEPDISRHR